MSEAMSHDDMLNMPISSVIDGWTVNNGQDLYLWVKREDGVVQTITVPRQNPWSKKNRRG